MSSTFEYLNSFNNTLQESYNKFIIMFTNNYLICTHITSFHHFVIVLQRSIWIIWKERSRCEQSHLRRFHANDPVLKPSLYILSTNHRYHEHFQVMSTKQELVLPHKLKTDFRLHILGLNYVSWLHMRKPQSRIILNKFLNHQFLRLSQWIKSWQPTLFSWIGLGSLITRLSAWVNIAQTQFLSLVWTWSLCFRIKYYFNISQTGFFNSPGIGNQFKRLK